ncbi:RNA polymerase sigma-70 factor [Parabacteroides chinchillae]|uniref:RNA polymerase sigma-70 factor, ECF subfamily n=1 Tax=Parabacteroides chinchillae TaxID=871327 RepID=A0A8G2BYU1_9BACT|nr:RNA polymerase sigma-70 factor [Parabacteroides chinchillae]SEG24126.1 RNA polymerase sigma-70 factor, ECF subfamily [Parabacteroides chinchillae]
MKIRPVINENTFRGIYDEYYGYLCRNLSFYTHDIGAIEDIVQEIFVKLWNERDLYEIDNLKTYLSVCAKNKMLNYLRDEQTRKNLLNTWAKNTNEVSKAINCVDEKELGLLMLQAINNLPPKCQKIYLLSREEKLSYKQIAELLRVSIKTVETQMGIAIHRIKEFVAMHYTSK